MITDEQVCSINSFHERQYTRGAPVYTSVGVEVKPPPPCAPTSSSRECVSLRNGVCVWLDRAVVVVVFVVSAPVSL